jgi:hypothetical protein
VKCFVLHRKEDVSGVSGTGIVAEGVQFTDGRIVMRWIVDGKPHTTTEFDSIQDLLTIHGHEGRTEVQWL